MGSLLAFVATPLNRRACVRRCTDENRCLQVPDAVDWLAPEAPAAILYLLVGDELTT